MSLEIVGNKQIGNSSVHKLLILAELTGTQAKHKPESKGSAQHGKHSVLITKDGVVLPTSVAIRYLARMRPDLGLYGQTFLETALVDKALRHTEYHVLIPLETMLMVSNKSSAVGRKAKEDILCALEDCIEPQLLNSTFLINDRLTIADVDLALSLCDAISQGVISLMTLGTNYPSTKRWLELIMHQPIVMNHYDYKSLCTMSAKAEEIDKEKVMPEQKKKDKKTKQAEPKIKAEEDTETEETKLKKKINPLDELPASSFVLDEWKRLYSNCKKLRDEALPSFWKKHDPNGWSLWHIKYDKLEGENTQGYTTANMLGGFLQRIEPSFRQYSFGVNNVLGSPGDFDIEGLWLIRGSELPLELTEHPSFEYYTFTKLDPENDLKHKQLVEDFWCNDDVIGGRHIDSCKVWK